MKRQNIENNDFIYDAVAHLEAVIKKTINFESSRKEYDGILTIDNIHFTVEAKSEIRLSNKGVVLNQIQKLKEITSRPLIIIAKYIASDIAQEFKDMGYNYIDVAGNCYISYNDLLIYITGQKVKKISKTNQSRAFQESGIKLIFNLLRSPENLQLSYRKLAELSDISIGSVSNVMTELEELKFILKTKKKRKLKNTADLLNRWIVAYNDVLKPRIFKKRMRFTNENDYKNWNEYTITKSEKILWGSETAASILTNKLRPEIYTIYINENWQIPAKKFKLMPDENGDVEIYQMFWKDDANNDKPIVPALLIYADLISSGYNRNIEIAQIILENELQYIK
jgi:hypothetical protein